MSCADCEDCKGVLERYLKNPLKVSAFHICAHFLELTIVRLFQCINSAASDGPESLEDLRAIVLNGNHTPLQLAKTSLAMFVAHLSAGDQENFETTWATPREPPPVPAKGIPVHGGHFHSLPRLRVSGGTLQLWTGSRTARRVAEDSKWIHHFPQPPR